MTRIFYINDVNRSDWWLDGTLTGTSGVYAAAELSFSSSEQLFAEIGASLDEYTSEYDRTQVPEHWPVIRSIGGKVYKLTITMEEVQEPKKRVVSKGGHWAYDMAEYLSF